LKTNNVIEGFYLQNNNIGNQGAIQIAKAIAFNRESKLDRLWLSFNKIGDKGATALSSAIGHNGTDVNPESWQSKITDLDLKKNDISLDGARSVMDMARCNTRLQKVQMDDNDKLSKKYLDDLKMTVMMNSHAKFRQIKIDKCKMLEQTRLDILSGKITMEEVMEEERVIRAENKAKYMAENPEAKAAEDAIDDQKRAAKTATVETEETNNEVVQDLRDEASAHTEL
jgi:hypothetical protein